MTVTMDMWVASGVPGYGEVREFHKRMAEKINWNPGGNMFAANPQVSGGMAEAYKEVAKLDGMPVQQTISMGMAGQPGAAEGGASPAQQQQSQPQAQQQPAERPSVGGALGSALGGRFGLGRKKPADQQASSDNPPASGGQASSGSGAPGSLLEMTTELSTFSSNAVDPSLFEVPAGFKKVESDMKKRAR
jgi:hypothetical protein